VLDGTAIFSGERGGVSLLLLTLTGG
jgi:hypothetical protein